SGNNSKKKKDFFLKESKEQFESITIGDKVSGYMRNEDTFLTDKNIQFESMIGIPVLVLLYLVLFFWIIALLNSTTFVKRLYKVMAIAFKSTVIVMFIMYLISGLIMISLVATNTFHKLNKMSIF